MSVILVSPILIILSSFLLIDNSKKDLLWGFLYLLGASEFANSSRLKMIKSLK